MVRTESSGGVTRPPVTTALFTTEGAEDTEESQRRGVQSAVPAPIAGNGQTKARRRHGRLHASSVAPLCSSVFSVVKKAVVIDGRDTLHNAPMWVARIAGWVALCASLIAAAGALLPLSPETYREGFYATLHLPLAQSDTHLISTFGPLGFLFFPVYLPQTFAWLFALRAVLAAATCWALAWLGYAAWRGPWGAAVAVAACAPFFASPDVWFLLLPLLAALMELTGLPVPGALRLVLGAAIGMASLIKFSFLLAAIAVLAPLTAAAVLRRRVPLLTIGALLGGGVAWAATGHGWSDWLVYLDWSGREISPGYSNAMQLPADRNLTQHAAAVTVGVWAAGALLAWWRLRRAAWAVVLALATTLFLIFKAGFVRADV